jgi:hypothetical protein
MADSAIVMKELPGLPEKPLATATLTCVKLVGVYQPEGQAPRLEAPVRTRLARPNPVS